MSVGLAETVSDAQLQAHISDALPDDVTVKPLAGFKLNLSANDGFRKVFFSARCECGTAALLSVEVSKEKTDSEITAALPSLVGRLASQVRSFQAMSCEAHTRMRLGPVHPGG